MYESTRSRSRTPSRIAVAAAVVALGVGAAATASAGRHGQSCMVTVNNLLADGGDNFAAFTVIDPSLRQVVASTWMRWWRTSGSTAQCQIRAPTA